MKTELHNMHKRLFSLIANNPTTVWAYKRHGNWLKLDLGNSEFFQVDTWNKAILLKRGSGDEIKGYGFSGETFVSLGGDFGGFWFRGTVEEMRYALALAEQASVAGVVG